MIRTERRDDGSIVAVSDVTVGVDTRAVRVPLGRYGDTVDPGGLRNTPVVVAVTREAVAFARAGAEHAGRASVAAAGDETPGPVGARLLDGARAAEVVIAVTWPAEAVEALTTARALGGRPLPAIPLGERDAVRDMLDGCWVDLDIAVPAVEGDRRAEVRRTLEDLGLFMAHHVVEVDPRPALGGRSTATMSLGELAAASTGVLAGRIAAGTRRWR